MSNELKTHLIKGLAITGMMTLSITTSSAQDASSNTIKKKTKDPATHVDYKSPPAPITRTAARSTQALSTATANKTKTKSGKVPADNHPKREMPF